MDEQDPFRGLEDWGKATERRIRRERRRSGLRRRAAILGPVFVVVLLLIALVPTVRSWLADDSTQPAAYATEPPPAGVTVTTLASAAPTDPFAGTPAATYPKAEAGISLPPAKAVAGFTAAQVDAALRQVRSALVAGRLDATMLVSHNPGPFLSLLAPTNRRQISKWFKTPDFTSVATWIDPAVALNGREPPRVSGRVTYTSARVHGLPTLQITTNFVWVYAFARVEQPLAARHDQIHWEFPSTRDLRAADRGMWVMDSRSYGAWVDCAAARRGLLAPGQGVTVAPDPQNSEEPDAYLRADHSLDIGDDCHLPSPAPSH